MAFKKIPPRVRLACGSASSIIVQDTKVLDGVSMSVTSKKSFNEVFDKLPQSDNFTLDRQIEAGVPLQQVNSKLLGDDVNEVELPETTETLTVNDKN